MGRKLIWRIACKRQLAMNGRWCPVSEQEKIRPFPLDLIFFKASNTYAFAMVIFYLHGLMFSRHEVLPTQL